MRHFLSPRGAGLPLLAIIAAGAGTARLVRRRWKPSRSLYAGLVVFCVVSFYGTCAGLLRYGHWSWKPYYDLSVWPAVAALPAALWELGRAALGRVRGSSSTAKGRDRTLAITLTSWTLGIAAAWLVAFGLQSSGMSFVDRAQDFARWHVPATLMVSFAGAVCLLAWLMADRVRLSPVLVFAGAAAAAASAFIKTSWTPDWGPRLSEARAIVRELSRAGLSYAAVRGPSGPLWREAVAVVDDRVGWPEDRGDQLRVIDTSGRALSESPPPDWQSLSFGEGHGAWLGQFHGWVTMTPRNVRVAGSPVGTMPPPLEAASFPGLRLTAFTLVDYSMGDPQKTLSFDLPLDSGSDTREHIVTLLTRCPGWHIDKLVGAQGSLSPDGYTATVRPPSRGVIRIEGPSRSDCEVELFEMFPGEERVLTPHADTGPGIARTRIGP
jgi:hypothetical protein